MTAVSDGYNIWTVERKPVSVHLRESVAAQIRANANAPQESRAGLERGGLLWGRVRDTGEDYYLISIEFAEHLSCDHHVDGCFLHYLHWWVGRSKIFWLHKRNAALLLRHHVWFSEYNP